MSRPERKGCWRHEKVKAGRGRNAATHYHRGRRRVRWHPSRCQAARPGTIATHSEGATQSAKEAARDFQSAPNSMQSPPRSAPEHEAVLKTVQARRDRNPDKMRVRRQTTYESTVHRVFSK